MTSMVVAGRVQSLMRGIRHPPLTLAESTERFAETDRAAWEGRKPQIEASRIIIVSSDVTLLSAYFDKSSVGTQNMIVCHQTSAGPD